MARIADPKKPATKGSLMKQTKAELVSIILRKDATDKEKQAIIDELHKKAVTRVEYETLKDNYLAEIKKVNELKSKLVAADAKNIDLLKAHDDLKTVCDRDTVILQETKSKLKFWRDFAIASVLITLLVVILSAIL